MEDMSLFDRFHAAFEDAPPRGAFERLQSALIGHSAARNHRQPAFHMTWSRASLRLTAAFAALVILIALAAAYLAAQHLPVGAVPAASVAAYQEMIDQNHSALINAASGYCDSVASPTCARDLQALMSADRQFQHALAGARTPQPFVLIDAQLRRHLKGLDVQFTQALAAVNAQNQAQFDEATGDTAYYHEYWIDLVTGAIVNAAPTTSSHYIALTGAVGDILGGCIACGALIGLAPNACFDEQAALCFSYLRDAASNVTEEQAALVQGLAPSSFVGAGLNVQRDLAVADTAIGQMFDARTAGDQSAFNSARATFQSAMSVAQTDISDISSS